MKIIKINKNGIEGADLDLIVEYLRNGKIVVLPTDTIYGLHCVANSEKAIKKIIKIKERAPEAGFAHLVKSLSQVREYCQASKKQEQYMRRFWPSRIQASRPDGKKHKKKPTTFILARKSRLPQIGSGGKGTLAVRLPADDFLVKILKKINIPLVSTSFNISGKEAVPFSRIESEFKILPDLVIDAGQSESQASRIVDISNMRDIKIIRK